VLGGYLIWLITSSSGFSNISNKRTTGSRLLKRKIRTKELWVVVISRTSNTCWFYEKTESFLGGYCEFFKNY